VAIPARHRAGWRVKASLAIEYLKAMPADEPVFVLRAQDVLAPRTVEFWAEGAEQAGVRSGKVAGARECAVDMAAWPTRKQPD
jgi:hypothetical protein